MITSAKLRHLRIAPRKVRLIADLIRGKKAGEAQSILDFAVKKASHPLLKLLKSALANAKNNFQLDEANLYVSKITVDEGPKLERWMPRSRGQAYKIQKKTSHITIVLEEIKESKKKAAKKIKRDKGKKPEELLPKTEAETEKTERKEKPRFRPESETAKPQFGRGIKRMFRRKSF